jgi:hypothetical protein
MHHLYTGDTNYRATSDNSESFIKVGGDDTSGGLGNQAGEGCSFVLWLTTPSDATKKHNLTGASSTINGSGDGITSFLWGGRKSVMAVTDIEIHLQAGNISTGRLTLWGLKHS